MASEKIMQKDLSYIDAVKIVLQKATRPLKVAELWKEIVKEGLDKRLKSVGKTPDRSLHTILLFYTRKVKTPEIFVFSENPRTFWLENRKKDLQTKEKVVEQIQKAEQTLQKKFQFIERDLHPLLVKFIYESEFDAYAKTIYHEQSKSKSQGLNKWLHPDIVGVHFVIDEFKEKEMINLFQHLNQPSYKLYSFELKRSLDSNFKEYYFQAVSNSSWANEGYLVIFDKNIDEERFEELERLNASFGIGLIRLDTNITDCEILLRAKPKELDINTINKLIEENINFREFIKDINNKIKTHGQDLNLKDNFDKVLNDEEFDKYLKDKNITKD